MTTLVRASLLVLLGLLVFTHRGRSGKCDPKMSAEASRRFAYKLYAKTIAQTEIEGNVFLAPTTVASALAMVVGGAKGETKSQLMNGLLASTEWGHFTEDDLPCLLQKFNDASGDELGDSEDTDQALALKTATRIFGEKSYKFDKNYLTQTESFGAKLKRLNFVGATETSRRRINGWVRKQTNDKIKNLLPDGSITPDTILAIASAIYFKGLWQIPFDAEATRTRDFRVSEDNVVQTEFMYVGGRFRSSRSDSLGAELLELPYQGSADGRHNVSMIIVKPGYRGSMASLQQKLTEENLAPAIADLLSQRAWNIDVSLPKFKLEAEYDLKPILVSMGIQNMFSQSDADLSGMRSPKSEDTRPLYVSSAVHKTFIEVDEKGTEAAGATGLVILALSLPPQFTVDQPFITIIYERSSQTVLFIGKVNDPTAE